MVGDLSRRPLVSFCRRMNDGMSAEGPTRAGPWERGAVCLDEYADSPQKKLAHTWKLHFSSNGTEQRIQRNFQAPAVLQRPCELFWAFTNVQRLQLRTQYWMSHIHIMNKLIVFSLSQRLKAGMVQRWCCRHGQDVSSPLRV